MIQFDRIYQKHPDMVTRKIVDEVILVPVARKGSDANSLYTLNEVGARIWELVDGRRSVRDIRETLLAEFDVSESVLTADLSRLVEQLAEIGALREI